jgi:hypothetical protein
MVRHRGCALLAENGQGEEFLSAEHDIIYLPPMEREVPYASKLEELGAFWDNSADSWAVFV